jgi:hypothetical protein
MIPRCSRCGETVPLLARTCAVCGTPNSAWNTVLGIVIAILVLVPAIAITIYAATHWGELLIKGSTSTERPSPLVSKGDFAWLSSAMAECDAKAAQEPSVLHFLVIPLASDPTHTEDWRKASLNDIGNAMALSRDDTLSGLQRQSLTISTGEYMFSIRDEKTQVVLRWEPSIGVKWFSTAEADSIASFRIQFKLLNKGQDGAWGNTIDRKKGNCYWINAISLD